MNDLKNHLEVNFKLPQRSLKYTISPDAVLILGYTSFVKTFSDTVHCKFNNLDNNIKDRCKRKLDFKLDSLKTPALAILSKHIDNFQKPFI